MVVVIAGLAVMALLLRVVVVLDEDVADQWRVVDDVFCTVCVRITCMAPLAVRSTSNCLRCVCCVPFGCEMFWESDICKFRSGTEKERERDRVLDLSDSRIMCVCVLRT